MKEDTNLVQAIELLEAGTITLEGLVAWGSNYTFLTEVCGEDQVVMAIYKPRHGERPLWDFARGTLCLRERAAYVLSEALGWRLVPPTILRDGPHGRGSLQLFVEHNPEEHYLTFQGRYPDQARRIALFDLIINNADRKSGHVLLGTGGHLWSIDHGICFHTDDKLRSVIWDFAGEPIPAGLLADLRRLHDCLADDGSVVSQEMRQLLSDREMAALQERLQRLLERRAFPNPGAGRYYPWPLV